MPLERLIGDKAYDSDQLDRQLAAEYGIELIAPIAALWRRQWTQVIPFFAFPEDIRKVNRTIQPIASKESAMLPWIAGFCSHCLGHP
jgi:hypothetical protein